MFTIDIDVQKKPGIIELGVQGDKLADAAVFDVTEWVAEYGAGTVYIYHQRASDAAPYFKQLPIVTADGKSTATWAFDDVDTAITGEGQAQLLFVKDEQIKKTPVFITKTSRSIGEDTGEAPDPYQDLISVARAILQNVIDQAIAASAKAGQAGQHEVQAKTYRDAAEGFAIDAASSAQTAANTFQIVGDASFSVDPVTKKVSLQFTIEE